MSMFEFFFKYRPIVYEKGRLSFQLLSSKWLFIPLALVAIARRRSISTSESRRKSCRRG